MEESDDDDVSMADVSMAGSDDEDAVAQQSLHPIQELASITQEAALERSCINTKMDIVESTRNSAQDPDEQPRARENDEHQPMVRTVALQQQRQSMEIGVGLVDCESTIAASGQLGTNKSKDKEDVSSQQSPQQVEQIAPCLQEALPGGQFTDRDIDLMEESSSDSGHEAEVETQARKVVERMVEARTFPIDEVCHLNDKVSRTDDGESAIAAREQLVIERSQVNEDVSSQQSPHPEEQIAPCLQEPLPDGQDTDRDVDVMEESASDSGHEAETETSAGKIVEQWEEVPIDEVCHLNDKDSRIVGGESAIVAREQFVIERGQVNEEIMKELEAWEMQLAARTKELDAKEAELNRREDALKQMQPQKDVKTRRSANAKADTPRTRLDAAFIEIATPVQELRTGEQLTRGQQTRAIASAGPRQEETRSCRPAHWLQQGDIVTILRAGTYRGMKATIRKLFGGRLLECAVEANGDIVHLRKDEVQLVEEGKETVQRRYVPDKAQPCPAFQKGSCSLGDRRNFAHSTPKPQSKNAQEMHAHPKSGITPSLAIDAVNLAITPNEGCSKSDEESAISAALAILGGQKRKNYSVESGSGFAMLRSAMRRTSKSAAVPDGIITTGGFSRLGSALDAVLPNGNVNGAPPQAPLVNRAPPPVAAKAEGLAANPKKRPKARALRSDRAKRLWKDIDAGVNREPSDLKM